MVGVRVGFNPVEFVDFLLGWFGLDILNDDDGHYLRVSKPGEKPKPVLWERKGEARDSETDDMPGR